MDANIIAALITAFASVLAAALIFYLTKRHEMKVQWRNEKLNHYKVLLSSISSLGVDRIDKDEATMKLALAANTIALVAPQYVISALMAYLEELIQSRTKDRHNTLFKDRHNTLLRKLLLAIRKDIGLADGDNADNFNFLLITIESK